MPIKPIKDHAPKILQAIHENDVAALEQEIAELRKTYQMRAEPLSKDLVKNAELERDENYLHGFLNNLYTAALAKGDIRICLLFAANGA